MRSIQNETASFQGELGRVLADIRLVKASNSENVEEDMGKGKIRHLYRYGMKEAKIQAFVTYTPSYTTGACFQDFTDWMKTYTADEEEMIDELLAVGVAETVNLYDSDQNIGITLTTIIADNNI